MPELYSQLSLQRPYLRVLEHYTEKMSRTFRGFEFRSANYRVAVSDFDQARKSIRNLWGTLEKYLVRYPEFARSLTPLSELPEPAPESARRMHAASQLTGVGPMAAVAGTFAQMAVEMCRREFESSGSPGPGLPPDHREEYIFENGGDIYAVLNAPCIVGLWIPDSSPFHGLAFRISPADSPMAICSSSSVLGHSYSLGSCDLVTVFSADASLADACATAVCNRIASQEVLQESVEEAIKIPGINGILALKGDKMAVAGKIPELIRHGDPELRAKVTRHDLSSF